MMLLFNSHGLFAGVSDFGTHESPDSSANQHRFKLVDGEVIDGWPDVSDENIMDSYNAAMEVASLADFKDESKTRVKLFAKQKIEDLGWKVERATEQDAMNGTNTIADVYAEREAVRVASNDAEAAIDAESDYEAIRQLVIDFRQS